MKVASTLSSTRGKNVWNSAFIAPYTSRMMKLNKCTIFFFFVSLKLSKKSSGMHLTVRRVKMSTEINRN
jgi:hypothetical protein